MSQMLRILGIACLAAAAPAVAAATDDPTRADERSSKAEASGGEATSAAPASGLRVVVDPETGAIVENPSARQLEDLSETRRFAKRRPARELRSFPLATGGEGVFLDGWANHSLKVEVTSDGKLRTACSQGDRHGAQNPDEDEER